MKSNTITYTYTCDLCGKTETFIADERGYLLSNPDKNIGEITRWFGDLSYHADTTSGRILHCEHICSDCKNKFVTFLIENFPNSVHVEKLKAIRDGKLDEYYASLSKK